MTAVRTIAAIFFVLSLQAACTGGSGEGMSRPDAQAGPDAAADALLLTCNADQSAFPPLSRSCQSANDCAVAIHTIDCCGSSIATGIAQSDVASFEEAESACAPIFPACGCAAFPPVLDDGTSSEGSDTIEVACSEAGICQTFGPPQPGA